ncbi:MAG: flagellar hook-length control protein FliK [Nitrospirota bacterium]
MNEVTTNGLDTSNVISQLLKPSASEKAQSEDNFFYDLMGSILNMFPDHQSIPVQKNQQATEDSTKIQSPLLSNLFSRADLAEKPTVVHFDICKLLAGLSADQILSGLKGYREQYLIPQDEQQIQSDFLNNTTANFSIKYLKSSPSSVISGLTRNPWFDKLTMTIVTLSPSACVILSLSKDDTLLRTGLPKGGWPIKDFGHDEKIRCSNIKKDANADLTEKTPVIHFDIGKLFAGLSADQILSGLKGYGEQYLIPQDEQQVQPDLLNIKKDAGAALTEEPPAIHFDIGKLFAGLSAEGVDSETEESLLKSLFVQISSISSQMQSDMVFQNEPRITALHPCPDTKSFWCGAWLSVVGGKADFIQTFSLTKEPDASVFHHTQATGDGNESTPADAKSNLFVMQPKPSCRRVGTKEYENSRGILPRLSGKMPALFSEQIPKSTSDCDVKSLLSESSIKSTRNEMAFLSETSAQGRQSKNMKYDQYGKTLEIIDSHAGALSSPENVTNQDSAKIVHHATETPETNRLFRNTFIITRRDGTAIEVSLEPDGIGKLDIHLSLDRGLVNAKIGVSETVGKELIERNIHSIVNALHNEGINIGSFSVHLKDRRKEFKDEEKNMKVFCVTDENKHLPINSMNNRIVSIFV